MLLISLLYESNNEFLADMHYINPLKALMMAKALKVLPKQVLFLGSESREHEKIGIAVSAVVEAALPVAFKKIEDRVTGTKKEVSPFPKSFRFIEMAFRLITQSLLLTKAIRLLSGDHDGVLIEPWPPYK